MEDSKGYCKRNLFRREHILITINIKPKKSSEYQIKTENIFEIAIKGEFKDKLIALHENLVKKI